ncbi:MAG: GNAT family N-acetyltransferase [Hyphomonadaceae bacterium]|nr:GNAT family N-acetyltransferase [Hyphomonadaceae bacterium]
MRIETVHPKELGPVEAALWRAHQVANPDLGSPYLSPIWAHIVGAARADARVCVIQGGRGFLGVQRCSRFAAMGLGAPLADYQGVVSEVGIELDGAALCRALGVGRIDLTAVPAAAGAFSDLGGEEGSWIADVSAGLDAYRAHQKKHRGKVMRQTDKRAQKLADEHGEVVLGISGEHAHFETLMAWKSAQLRASGQPAIWDKPWVRQVVEATYAARDPSLSGVFATLTAGGKLIAATYALRGERALHCWLLGHDNAYDAYSPGMILSRWLVEWAAGQGLAEVDFGVGDYQFKRHLSTGQRMLRWGCLARPSFSGVVRQAEIGLRARIEKLPNQRLAALPGKAMRRLDLMRALAA